MGYIAAEAAFGTAGGRFTGIVLAMLLISTVSAMVMAGPRVIQMIGEDFPLLSVLGKTNAHGVPAIAIYAQGIITLVFVFSSTFESVLVFSGFTLAINNFATVSVFSSPPLAPAQSAAALQNLSLPIAAAYLFGSYRMDPRVRDA